MIHMLKAARSRFAKLRTDRSGVAAVEFAFAAPILLTMYLGGYQLMDAAANWRKVTTTTRAIADLTSQYKTVTDAELDAILAASQKIMAPYVESRGTYRVSLITVSAAGAPTVAWSRSRNGTPLTTNDSYNLPAQLRRPGTNLVVADVTYQYTPIAAGGLIGTIPLADQIFMMPRGSATITRTAS